MRGFLAIVTYIPWLYPYPQCNNDNKESLTPSLRISNSRAARVLFFIKSDQLYLLHGFIKKSTRIPKPDLELAKSRKRKMEG